MSKQDVLYEGRMQGMRYALEVLESKGIDGLKEEIHMRDSRIGYHNTYNYKARQEERDLIIDTSIHIILAFGLLTLHNEFGWGKVRLARWYQEMVRYSEGFTNGEYTLDDAFDLLKQDTGYEIADIEKTLKKISKNY